MRYELTDFEWASIRSYLPNKPRGIPRVDDRRVRTRQQASDHGSISTPGFIMPFGSSSRLAPRSARANSSGRCLS
jgi:hypothetical protein